MLKNAVINSLAIILISMIALTAQNDSLRLAANAGHTGNIASIIFSPDGNFYAAADEVEVKLFETGTGREIRSFDAGKNKVPASFNADGTILAVAAGKGLNILETKTGKLIRHLKGFYNPVFGAGGKLLLALKGGLIRVLDARTFEEKGELIDEAETEAVLLRLGTDEKLLAVQHEHTIKIWNMEKQRETGVVMKHPKSYITGFDLSPDGKLLASCATDGTTRIWDTGTGVELHRLKLPDKDNLSNEFYAVRFSRDGRMLATGSLFGIHLWNAEEGISERELETARTDAIDFSPDGKSLTGGMLGGKIRAWDLAGGKLQREFIPDFDDVNALAFSPDGKQLVSITNAVAFWNFGDSPGVKILGERGHSLSFTGDGKILALGTYSGVSLLDPATVKNIPTVAADKFQRLSSGIQKTSVVSPDGKTVAVGKGLFDPGPSTLYDTASGAVIRTFEGFKADTQALAFSPDGRFLASAGANLVKIAETSSGKTVHTLNAADHEYEVVRAVVFNPKGDLLAAGGLGEEIRIWNAADGTLLKTIKTGEDVNSIDFSPDGKTLMAGLSGGAIGLWNAADGSLLKTMAAHFGDVNAVAFHPNGKFLAGGGEDGRIKIWGAESGDLLAELLIINRTDWVVIAPDNRFDSSAGADSFLHWVEGVKTFPLEKYAAKYRTPGLLKKILAR